MSVSQDVQNAINSSLQTLGGDIANQIVSSEANTQVAIDNLNVLVDSNDAEIVATAQQALDAINAAQTNATNIANALTSIQANETIALAAQEDADNIEAELASLTANAATIGTDAATGVFAAAMSAARGA